MTIWTVAALVIGLVLLVGGAEALVKSASKLAATAGISPLVIGLTVVAFGTSAPELTVSLQASLSQQADIALGNVVGSNICNVLLILGISAMIAPLVVAQQLIRLDVPIMIGVSALVMLFGWDGQIGRSDGVILFLGGIAYTLFLLYQSRRDKDPVVQAEYAQFEQRSHSSKETALNVGLLVVGLVMLIAGSQLLIQSAVTIATLLGVSELMIGLTVVAVGTSLPELATSVTASLRGESDIAVGNVVGSNIFNILVVLGLSGAVSPTGTGVSPAAIAFDIPVMIAVAAMCLPICFTGNKISRKEGALLFTYYLLYVGYLATNMINPGLSWPIWIGIVPVGLTLLTLLSWRTEKSPDQSIT
ncbi:MAG: sodium:calcium antiporter [Leptolyngbya foveolarum]|uniref:Sodium:calcium antiporter n=1 Tax=Leptolyngbya foveolarum TaxID=47253 RepID=A0A2W4UHF7_9CYAN|nr:MAG: sodium:calcium antiporter [Leptolyngbya foveolarum]